MTRDVYTVSPDDSILAASKLMRRRSVRHVPVIDDQRLVGIITDRDIKRAAPSLLSGSDQTEYENTMRTTMVSRIMTREPFTLGLDAEIRAALRLMVEHKIGAVPIMDGERLAGIITGYDLLKEFLEMLPGDD